MTHHKCDKCIKCDKLVYSTLKHLVCSQCSNSLHLKCSRLNKKTGATNKKILHYICQFCTNYKCIKCEKHVYYSQKGFFCSGCDLWIHQKCAGLNNSQYKLIQNNPNDPWYCRPYKNDMFPFFRLLDYQIFNYIYSQKFIKPKPSTNKQVTKKNNMLTLLQKQLSK